MPGSRMIGPILFQLRGQLSPLLIRLIEKAGMDFNG